MTDKAPWAFIVIKKLLDRRFFGSDKIKLKKKTKTPSRFFTRIKTFLSKCLLKLITKMLFSLLFKLEPITGILNGPERLKNVFPKIGHFLTMVAWLSTGHLTGLLRHSIWYYDLFLNSQKFQRPEKGKYCSKIILFPFSSFRLFRPFSLVYKK